MLYVLHVMLCIVSPYCLLNRHEITLISIPTPCHPVRYTLKLTNTLQERTVSCTLYGYTPCNDGKKKTHASQPVI